MVRYHGSTVSIVMPYPGLKPFRSGPVSRGFHQASPEITWRRNLEDGQSAIVVLKFQGNMIQKLTCRE